MFYNNGEVLILCKKKIILLLFFILWKESLKQWWSTIPPILTKTNHHHTPQVIEHKKDYNNWWWTSDCNIYILWLFPIFHGSISLCSSSLNIDDYQDFIVFDLTRPGLMVKNLLSTIFVLIFKKQPIKTLFVY